MEKDYTPIYKLLEGNFLDTFLKHDAKEGQQTTKWVCRTLETMAMEIFTKHGWSSFKRIDA
jgi:hypothetical protein